MKISKESIEIFLVFLLFIVSCIHPMSLYFSLIVGVLYIFKGYIGLFKLMFLLILRTNISPGIFFDISDLQIFQIFKWIIIIVGSVIVIVFQTIKIKKIDKIIIFILIISFYFAVTSLFYSNNISLSMLKITSYVLPLLAFYSSREIIQSKNLKAWVNKILIISLIMSLTLIFTSVGYLRNGHGFQGIFNNPNMLGIISVISFSLNYTLTTNNKLKYFYLLLYFFVVIISESRTSLLSMFVLMLIFLFFLENKRSIKILNLILCLLMGILIGLSNFRNSIIAFFQKGQQSTDILHSRDGQLESLKIVLQESPIFGKGFGVPVMTNPINIDSTIVEAGNLFIALIMFGGIFGLVLFMFFIFYWLKFIKINYIGIFLSTLLICMGEMVLFSSNSIGLWCSLLWVISLDRSRNKLT
ncbi:O-antigen ligase domain-containing protein [Mammaliicoccus sciuri]|uniref:O-antigen ligase family protein n=1 Tax=Mammaliicoccus TaxID=2803850 RepID=UPI000E679F6D|nr:O-antigen ligase family protein [Mammaliicoccus sciuri]RIO04081.1 O-antigen ligase domain-containing protein [Mammaliicoccus sciuri]